MKKSIIAFALCCLVTGNANAQEEKLVVTPSGRILLDAGVFDASEQKEKLNDGMAIPDMRVGFKAKYGKWGAKVDVAYSYGKVGMKDVNIDYTFNTKNLIRAGYFVHHFGLQNATSSSFKVSMEEPNANVAFNNSRLLGVMFEHSDKTFLGTISLFSETDAMKMSSDQTGDQGVGAMTRLLYRPFTEPGKIFQIGISGAVESPTYNADKELNHHSFTVKTTFPTRIANVTASQAIITEAKTMYKFSPEINAAWHKLAIESQYYYYTVNRKADYKNYKASGAYVTLRGLIKGRDYKYTYWDGGLDLPEKGAMEVVAAYSYSDLSDHKANVFGGRVSDWSLTYNYYINKYMIWRVRGSYTHVTDRADFENNNVKMLETRLQIKF